MSSLKASASLSATACPHVTVQKLSRCVASVPLRPNLQQDRLVNLTLLLELLALLVASDAARAGEGSDVVRGYILGNRGNLGLT